MTIALLPQPKHLDLSGGTLKVPARASVGIAAQELYPAAGVLRGFLPRAAVHAAVRGTRDTVVLTLDGRQRPGGYTLRITPEGAAIAGRDAAAVAHGVQTLRQVAGQCAGAWPCLEIRDWPDLPERGVYYDVCRGRVPTLASLLELADQLARYKVNHLQLYVEHTFAFRRHPLIGRGASPLEAEDILRLDAHCAARGIELVPSLASFGHLATVLKHPAYHHLAEDRGVGRIEDPDDKRQPWQVHKAWSLSPAVPEVYDFLDSLFAEFLPLFRSRRFNICCDETWDLGLGQSYKLCKAKGKGKVYLEHIRKVRDLSAKHGKTIMFWGDIIRHHPELIAEIPADATVLDWGYAHNHAFDAIKDFKKAGLPFFACPGTSSWVSLFPRLPEAMANIHGFAEAGRRHGAAGLLNTDWGDGGHYNFLECSWHGYLFGAEQGWNTAADQDSFHARFARLFLRSTDKRLPGAVEELGRIAFLNVAGCYQSYWAHLFFAVPGEWMLVRREPVDVCEVVDGAITTRKRTADATLGAAYLARIRKVRALLAACARERGADPQGVLPYWIFAADTIAHAARKLTVLGPGGADTPAARRALRREMAGLMARFRALWLARNRTSEIRITLARYRKAMRALAKGGPA